MDLMPFLKAFRGSKLTGFCMGQRGDVGCLEGFLCLMGCMLVGYFLQARRYELMLLNSEAV